MASTFTHMCHPVVVVKSPKSPAKEEVIVIDSSSSSGDHDCCIIEDVVPPSSSSQPVEQSCSSNTTTSLQYPNTPILQNVNTPVPLMSIDHMIQSNVTQYGEDHMISLNEESKHPAQCNGLLMLSQYDSDSELEPGEVL